MTDDILSPEQLAALAPDRVSPAVVALASSAAPTKQILLAGGGSFEQAHVTMTQGLYLGDEADPVEAILASWQRIADRTGEVIPTMGGEQSQFEVGRALAAKDK